MSRGLLIVVSAPSGCGKGTVLEKVKERSPFWYSVSATTRQPREGEKDGVNYFFMTKEQFTELSDKGGFLESAEFVGNFYGTPRAAIEEKLKQGTDVVLEIEVQGAMQVRAKCPEAMLVFILPPSVGELERRLHKRATDGDDVIKKRVARAAEEIPFAMDYDHVIVNDELETAVDELVGLIRSEKDVRRRRRELIEKVLEERGNKV